MNKQTEAVKLALEHAKRDERHLNHAETRYWCRMYRDIAEKAIEALAEQPAPEDSSVVQPAQQELVQCPICRAEDWPYPKCGHVTYVEHPAQQDHVVCCGEFETCIQACTPRGRFLGKREALAEQPAQQEPDLSGLKPATREAIKGWIADGTFINRAISAMKEQESENMRLEKMVAEKPAQQQGPVNKYCCHLCFKKSGQMFLDRMILCPECGNKRCPKATYHELPCANSNEPGQPGSLHTSPPAQQEPVAWMIWTHGPVLVFMNKDKANLEFDRLNRMYPEPTRMLVPLYKSPPAQRTWVGLADEEIDDIYQGVGKNELLLVRALEAKLKEKNT